MCESPVARRVLEEARNKREDEGWGGGKVRGWAKLSSSEAIVAEE